MSDQTCQESFKKEDARKNSSKIMKIYNHFRKIHSACQFIIPIPFPGTVAESGRQFIIFSFPHSGPVAVSDNQRQFVIYSFPQGPAGLRDNL